MIPDRQKIIAQLGVEDDGISHADIAWYIEVLITAGAWIGSIALVLPIAALFGFANGSEAGLALPAILMVGIAFFLLRRPGGGPFLRQFASTIALVGEALLVATAGSLTESVLAAAGMAVVLLLVSLRFLPQASIQFPATIATLGLIILGVGIEYHLWAIDLVVTIAVALGTYLLISPPHRLDLRGFATALVFLGPLVLSMGELGMGSELGNDDWHPGRAAQIILIGVSLWLVWQLRFFIRERLILILLAVAVFVLGILMPAGLYGSVIFLLIAYALGSTPWAFVGSIGIIYAISRIYYNIGLTLMIKSFLLGGAGIVCIALWIIAERASRVSKPHG